MASTSFPAASSSTAVNSEASFSLSNFQLAMASASSAGSSISTAANSGYDVFINHRGPDSKDGFATDLYQRLLSHEGIRVFLDRPEMTPGEYITAQIEGAIRSASVHVAIFSVGYAQSSWCLDELVLMLQSKAPIIPVFYHVEPSDLRWGKFAEDLGVLANKTSYDRQTKEHKLRYDSSTIQSWRNALSNVAGRSGFVHDANSDEGELLRKVVAEVLNRVKTAVLPFEVAKYPTGLDDKIKHFENEILKQLEHNGKPPITGLVGLGGVGKTTLAKEFFNRKNSDYSKSCFLSDVNKGGLLSLQTQLLKSLNVPKDIIKNIKSVDQGIPILREHLSSANALVVIDDADHGYQVDALLPHPTSVTVTSDSLVVITSRNRDVLRSAGVEESCIYHLSGLTTQHSLELFCWHSFNQPHPPQEFESLVDKFVEACGELPLSLKVVGAHLHRKDAGYWEDQLNKFQHILPKDIKQTLQISYDALDEEEQMIFLDIACFFIGEDRDTAIRIWGDGGVCGFQNLQSRCLVEVDDQNKIKMHDHLRDLGRDLAKAPGLPRRLWRWTDDDIDDFLQLSDSRIPVRGIRMILHDIYPYFEREGVRTRMLQFLDTVKADCMTTLQLLDTQDVFVERILTKVQSPKLLWLRWNNWPPSSLLPSKSLPSSISLKNLRVLHVSGGLLETIWENESQQAPLQLRELNIVVGNLSNIPKSIGKLKYLEQITIGSCYHSVSNLTKLPKEFCLLQSLKVLVLESCTRMRSLPNRFGNLTNLQGIHLLDCYALERLPDSFGNLTHLQEIQLNRCITLERLPDSFCKLIKLKYLDLSGCSNLTMSSETLGNIRTLEYINLDLCSKIEVLPQQVAHQRSLVQLQLDCTNVKELPSAIGELSYLEVLNVGSPLLDTLPPSLCHLSNLKELSLSECKKLKCLPPSLGDLRSLKRLCLIDCKELNCLPSSIGQLSQLTELIVHQCQLVGELPFFKKEVTRESGKLIDLESSILPRLQKLEVYETGISDASFAEGVCFNLQHLAIDRCDNLVEIGTLPKTLTYLSVCGCHHLRKVNEIYGLAKLEELDLSFCRKLEELPGMETLVSLSSLNANGCSKLKSIRGVEQLAKLKILNISGCSKLGEVDFQQCVLLHYLDLSGCVKLKSIQGVEQLAKLRYLNLRECSELEEVECIQHCVSLEHLWSSGCEKLKNIRGLEQLTKLSHLDISWCSELEEVEGIQYCSSLKYFYALDCPRLRLRAGVAELLPQRTTPFWDIKITAEEVGFATNAGHNPAA